MIVTLFSPGGRHVDVRFFKAEGRTLLINSFLARLHLRVQYRGQVMPEITYRIC
jgi:hypothetical protein